MRQAIVTKYLGPTDHRGSRIKVICDAKTITVSWDHALNPEDNHTAAATALADQLGWLGAEYNQRMCGGGMPLCSPYAYCFVMVPKS